MAVNSVLVHWHAEDTEWAVTATVSLSVPLGQVNTSTFTAFNSLTESQVLAWVDQEICNSPTLGTNMTWSNSNLGATTYVTNELLSQLAQARSIKQITVASPPWQQDFTVSNQVIEPIDNTVTDPVVTDPIDNTVTDSNPVVTTAPDAEETPEVASVSTDTNSDPVSEVPTDTNTDNPVIDSVPTEDNTDNPVSDPVSEVPTEDNTDPVSEDVTSDAVTDTSAETATDPVPQ
jgi:hypothetical protein